MIEMSPFYAHESSVGPVFDVATWSRFKTASMAIVCLGVGIVALAVLLFAWCPDLILDNTPEFVSSFHDETLQLEEDKPWAAYCGSALVALIGYISVAAACACAADVFHGDYYFRVGPGGISLRLPYGLDFGKLGFAFKRLQLDIAMSNLTDWTIVQRKQIGSMSRNSGNISASLKIRTVDGSRRAFGLDCFREPSFVIQSKINDALQMVPAQFGAAASPSDSSLATPLQVTGGIEEKLDAIQNALSQLIATGDHSPAVVVSDTETGMLVQFLAAGTSLLVDLPARAMDAEQSARATDYFQRLSCELADARDSMIPQTGLVTETGFQIRVSEADEAAQIALEVFEQVYRRPSDFPMEVEYV